MRAAALLGGPQENWPQNLKAELKKADVIFGVDRGSLLLEELGIIPDVAIGDFDSLKSAELAKIEKTVADIRYSTPIKDLTDSELMIKVAFEEYQVDELVIFGATGGRIDHFLVNLLMILNPQMRKFARKISIADKQNYVKFFSAGDFIVEKMPQYSYFGVAAISAVEKLTIKNARYDLIEYSGDYPRVFSSNEFLPDRDNFTLSLEKGFVSVIYSKDIDRFSNL